MQTNNSNEESKDDNFVGRGKPHAFSVINAVRDVCEQPDGIKVLLFTLATYCDRDGVCFPSNRTLTQATGKSERSIRRMLRQLASEGELEVLAPGIGRDQKRVLRLTRYVVRENGQSCGPFKPDRAVSAKPDKVVAPLNRPRSPGKVIAEQPRGTTINSHGKHTHAQGALSVSEETIDQIFDAYPRREGTAAAKRAIQKALRKVDSGTLLSAVERYSAHVRNENMASRYVPLLPRWLRDGRWLNEDLVSQSPHRQRKALTQEDFDADAESYRAEQAARAARAR